MKVSQASSTAQVIAGSIVLMSYDKHWQHLITPQTVHYCRQFLLSAGSKWFYLLKAMEKKWLRGLLHLIERATLPGIMLHYLLRKQFLRDWALTNLNQGYQQVVVLGAGFDTLCLELAGDFPTVKFIEIDHSATQQVKIDTLREFEPKPVNLSFIAADLAQADLTALLNRSPLYDAAKPTLIIAEGLLMYLPAEQVTNLFTSIRQMNQVAAAFSFLEPQDNGKPNFQAGSRLIDRWLRWCSEPFTWGIKRERLVDFLEGQGHWLYEITSDLSLIRHYLPSELNPVLAKGEYICSLALRVAEFKKV